MSPAVPELGDFGVVRTEGIGSALIRFGTDSPVNHAFVYVGDGQIVEAEPGGALLSPVNRHGDKVVWSTGAVTLATIERQRIACYARTLVGTPYGWPDIVAIALAQRRLGELVDSRTWWVRRIQTLDTLICSQLVDVAYNRAGVHLFDDGRLPGLVSPGDLLGVIDHRGASVRRDVAAVRA